MKRSLILVLIGFSTLFAQEFTVEKISGTVLVQKGISESWEIVEKGDILNAQDVIMTEDNSTVVLSKDDNKFLLKSDAALGLDKIREISLDELILSFALEQIEQVPERDKNSKVHSTAAYGKNEGAGNEAKPDNSQTCKRRLNGAIQLAQNGYRKSAVLAAKEIYRIYPATLKMTEERLYFVSLLKDMKLYNEAYTELLSIDKTADKGSERQISELRKEITTALGNQQ